MGYSPWGHKELDVTEHTCMCARTHTHTHMHTHTQDQGGTIGLDLAILCMCVIEIFFFSSRENSGWFKKGTDSVFLIFWVFQRWLNIGTSY